MYEIGEQRIDEIHTNNSINSSSQICLKYITIQFCHLFNFYKIISTIILADASRIKHLILIQYSKSTNLHMQLISNKTKSQDIWWSLHTFSYLKIAMQFRQYGICIKSKIKSQISYTWNKTTIHYPIAETGCKLHCVIENNDEV